MKSHFLTRTLLSCIIFVALISFQCLPFFRSILPFCDSVSDIGYGGAIAFADLMNVGGILRYYDESGREAESIGLDVSNFNNQIDYAALRDQGFHFVIIRLGGRGWGVSGRLYGDDQTWKNLRNAREAGLLVGAYYYSTAVTVTEAVEDAASSVSILNGFELDLPLFIDMEYSGNYPYGRADRLSPGTRADIAEAFCKAVESAGYDSGLYASEGYLRFDIDAKSISFLPVWMASYTVDNQLPRYVLSYDIWQQSDSTWSGGIDGAFDLNIVF